MKKIAVLFFLFISFCSLQAQVMWQINKDSVYTWYYQDGDEFNGTQLDRSKWDNSVPWSRAVMSQDMYFSDGQDLQESNGVLKFSLSKHDHYKVKLGRWDIDSSYMKKNKIQLNSDTFDFKYTAGLIWSKEKYKYGYFEMRFKCPKNGKGMWPAFWMYGGNKNDEIDFFELKCEKNNYVHVDMHCPDGCDNYPGGIFGTKKNWGGWIKVDRSLDEGFNTIAGEWDNGYIKWYLNGQGIAYFKSNLETAMHLIANMSIAKDGGPFSPGPDASTKFPGVMEVDYIRVWTKEKPRALKMPFGVAEAKKLSDSGVELPGNKAQMKKRKRLLYGKKTNYKNDGVFISLLRDNNKNYVFNLQGLDEDKVSIDIKDASGKSWFAKDNVNTEFLPVSLEGWQPGKYTVTIICNDKKVEHMLEYSN
jgi:beta-glucanase (GH16 family)